MIRSVIFDRDGTLIKHVPYLHDPADVELLPGVRAGLSRLKDAGYELNLHTNQSGVGRGMFELESVGHCNEAMIDLLGLGGDLFKSICVAPEHPSMPSKYRKPSPVFASEVAERLGCERSEICYVGDRATDLLTAKAAGTVAIGVATGLEDLRKEMLEHGLESYLIFDSFEEAVDAIFKL